MLNGTAIDKIDQMVTNPGATFFPDLNIQDLQELYRVPGVAPSTIERQILLAMSDCNLKLAAWQAAQIEAGGTALPANQTVNYEEAVQARAFGLFIKVLPALGLDKRIREYAEDLGLTPDDYFDRSDQRLSRISGESAGRGGLLVGII